MKFGLPETVVTDYGTGFVSQEFESFLVANGIKHVTSAPYHPASNGLAERAVQVVKRGLKKITTGRINSRLAKLLLTYRLQPQGTTGVSPAELLLGRKPRTRLDFLRPNTAERVEKKQLEQKERHDKRARSRVFRVGNAVCARNFGAGRRWLAARITSQEGPVSFRVRLEDGRERRCHQEQLRHRLVEPNEDTAGMSEPDVDDGTSLSFPPPSSTSYSHSDCC